MVALLLGHAVLSTPSLESARSFYVDALGGTQVVSSDEQLIVASGPSQLRFVARGGSWRGHLEFWTTEPLEAIAARLNASAEARLEGSSALICRDPAGNRVVLSPTPEGFEPQAATPDGYAGLVGLPRLVRIVPHGAAVAGGNLWTSMLAAPAKLSLARPGEPGISFCVAHFASGQQLVFEERPASSGEDPDDGAAAAAPEDGGGGDGSGADCRVVIYLTSIESFRVTFLACEAAGLLRGGAEGWERVRSSNAFAITRFPLPKGAVAELGGRGGGVGRPATASLGIELEVRSIEHADCPTGWGKRVGAGPLRGNFGEPARALAAKRTEATR